MRTKVQMTPSPHEWKWKPPKKNKQDPFSTWRVVIDSSLFNDCTVRAGNASPGGVGLFTLWAGSNPESCLFSLLSPLPVSLCWKICLVSSIHGPRSPQLPKHLPCLPQGASAQCLPGANTLLPAGTTAVATGGCFAWGSLVHVQYRIALQVHRCVPGSGQSLTDTAWVALPAGVAPGAVTAVCPAPHVPLV